MCGCRPPRSERRVYFGACQGCAPEREGSSSYYSLQPRRASQRSVGSARLGRRGNAWLCARRARLHFCPSTEHICSLSRGVLSRLYRAPPHSAEPPPLFTGPFPHTTKLLPYSTELLPYYQSPSPFCGAPPPLFTGPFPYTTELLPHST